MISRTEPETKTTTFSAFNAQGQPQSILEAGNRTRALAYDGLGRLLSMTSGGDSASNTYLVGPEK